ncbi:MAG TPA: type II secretion system F family protein [Armatimonadota bacterium]|nr:type II secretion system F family protein [Armatimonadota bacterium]
MSETESTVDNAEIAALCRQCSSLIHAEVNILEILEALRAQTGNEYLREVIDSVREDLEMGRTLATGFSRYPKTFSPFFISMVRQGELEGELDRMFAELATHYESRMEASVDASRLRGDGGAFDIESAASLFRWILTWIAALFGACAIGVGALVYADYIEALPGSLLGNACILVGVIVLMGVLLLARGKRG